MAYPAAASWRCGATDCGPYGKRPAQLARRWGKNRCDASVYCKHELQIRTAPPLLTPSLLRRSRLALPDSLHRSIGGAGSSRLAVGARCAAALGRLRRRRRRLSCRLNYSVSRRCSRRLRRRSLCRAAAAAAARIWAAAVLAVLLLVLAALFGLLLLLAAPRLVAAAAAAAAAAARRAAAARPVAPASRAAAPAG